MFGLGAIGRWLWGRTKNDIKPFEYFISDEGDTERRTLPAEVRVMVYNYYFTANKVRTFGIRDRKTVLIQSTFVDGQNLGPQNFSHDQLSLLCASKKIYVEATHVLWNALTFRFTDPPDVLAFCDQQDDAPPTVAEDSLQLIHIPGAFPQQTLSINDMSRYSHPFTHLKHVEYMDWGWSTVEHVEALWGLVHLPSLRTFVAVNSMSNPRHLTAEEHDESGIQWETMQENFAALVEFKQRLQLCRLEHPGQIVSGPTVEDFQAWLIDGTQSLVPPSIIAVD